MDLSYLKTPQDSNAITRAYLDNLLVEARYLDSCVPDTSFELYGKRFSSPIMIAAFSHLDGSHPGGMAEMARAAARVNVVNWAGMGDEEEFEKIAETGASTIKIVKPYKDRALLRRRLQHAAAHGALAVGIDIDHSFQHNGEHDVVNGLEMQPLTTEELKKLVDASPLPFVIKGVLSVKDALKCAEAGVKGIVISHHHGIQPCAVPPLMILPKIKAAAGDRLDLFVDCGISSGYDAFKALALGAKAVHLGRAVLPAFREKGAEGAADYIKEANDALRGMMARTGAPDLQSIDPECIWAE